jgi:hypothetical protein
MKTKLKVLSFGMVLAAVSVSGIAFASCPSDLTAEERVSCIHMEGAGLTYQDYLIERTSIISGAQAQRANLANSDIAIKRQDASVKEGEGDKKYSSSLNK